MAALPGTRRPCGVGGETLQGLPKPPRAGPPADAVSEAAAHVLLGGCHVSWWLGVVAGLPRAFLAVSKAAYTLPILARAEWLQASAGLRGCARGDGPAPSSVAAGWDGCRTPAAGQP